MSDPIIIEPKSKPKAAVIWLHGLGADGYDFAPIVPQLNLDDNLGIRFVFPHAPERPVTLNRGYIMRAWYDILGLDRMSKQDVNGIREAETELRKLITLQIVQGIKPEKIVLAGFSQGGAMALHVGLRYPEKLAGVMGLSTYLPIADHLAEERSEANLQTSIFLAHGDEDAILELEFANITKGHLEKIGYPIEWHLYKGMAHSVCEQEIKDISAWLRKVLE